MIQMEPTNSTRSNQSISRLSAAERGALYEFLSYIFSRTPNAEFIEHLRSETLIGRLKNFGVMLGEESDTEEIRGSLEKLVSIFRSLREIDEKSVTKLQEDYVRLFRGIKKGYGPPPPYESVYRSGSMMSDHASHVLMLYHKAGLEVRGGEPIDHIGLELALMAYLCKKEDECRKACDAKTANEFTSLQNDFLSSHLLEWMPQFCRNILNYDSAFYAAMAELTVSWLEFEKNNANARKVYPDTQQS